MGKIEFDEEKYVLECADFMQMQYAEERTWDKKRKDWIHSRRSLNKFLTDWEWIMAVVKKIEWTPHPHYINPFGSKYPCVRIERLMCSITYYGDQNILVVESHGAKKEQVVTEAIYQFLIWYKNNTPKKLTASSSPNR